MLKTHETIRPVATLWPDWGDEPGEDAITFALDSGGTIVISQRTDDLVLQGRDVDEFIKGLRFARKVAEAQQQKRK